MKAATTCYRLLACVLVFLVVGALPGCWDRKEIESLGFITMVGLDFDGERGSVVLTVHVAKPFAIGKEQAGAAAQEKPFWVTTVEAETVALAARKLSFVSPRTPSWGHCRLIVVGEDLARRGILDVIDWFDRNSVVGRRPNLLIVKGGTARDLLQGEFALERMPVQGYAGLLESVSRLLSQFGASSIIEFLRTLDQEGMDPVLPAFELVRVRDDMETPGELRRDEVKATARLTGIALFKKDKLVGWLDEEETRTYHWVRGFVDMDYMKVPDPERPGKVISLQLVRSRGQFQPEIRQGNIFVHVKVSVQAKLAEVDREFDPLTTPREWSEVEQALAKEVGNEVICLVSKAESLNADVFGFGAALYRKSPKDWTRVRDRWDELFPEITAEVEVDATLLGPGVSLRTIRPK